MQLLRNRSQKSYEQLYPRGLPVMVGDKNFLVESTTDWLANQIPGQPFPYLSYYHLLPPHEPYTTRADFVDLILGDGYEPLHKPRHPLSEKD
jgi:hypothetical protein